jgi:multiple sugar transport system permease protein
MDRKTKKSPKVKPPKPPMTSRRKREILTFYILIAPWIIGFLAFTLGPMARSLQLSFMSWNMMQPAQWIGTANFERIFTGDRYFFHSLRVTATFALGSVPLRLAFSLCIALLLRNILKGVKIFRTIYYVPVIISGVAVMVLWMHMFNPVTGLINQVINPIISLADTVLRFFGSYALEGVTGPGWLWDPNWALTSLIFMSLWDVGNVIIIWLAGLSGISKELYEAAQVDGANRLQQFRFMTIPALTPTIFFNLVMGVIGAMQEFGRAFVMTNGGPQNSTLLYNFYLFDMAFGRFRMGYASALAWILFIIIMILTTIVFKSSALWVHYESGRD